jgi:hypothetical protein
MAAPAGIEPACPVLKVCSTCRPVSLAVVQPALFLTPYYALVAGRGWVLVWVVVRIVVRLAPLTCESRRVTNPLR